jgi:hypothetical protein
MRWAELQKDRAQYAESVVRGKVSLRRGGSQDMAWLLQREEEEQSEKE